MFYFAEGSEGLKSWLSCRVRFVSVLAAGKSTVHSAKHSAIGQFSRPIAAVSRPVDWLDITSCIGNAFGQVWLVLSKFVRPRVSTEVLQFLKIHTFLTKRTLA